MKKIIIILVILSFYFVSLVLFGALVRHVANKGPYSNNIFAKVADNLAEIPSNIKNNFLNHDLAVKDSNSIDRRKKNLGLKFYFKENKKEEFILFSKYFDDEKIYKLQLFDVYNNSILHTWPHEDVNKMFKGDVGEVPRKYTYEHSMLLANGDVLISNGKQPVVRIDPCSNIVWKSTVLSHHSQELDHEKNIWVPIYLSEKKIIHGKSIIHDGLAKIDTSTGDTLYQKSLVEIMLENNLFDLIGNSYSGKNPLHLNDIQPVLKDGKFWKKGDIFLSMRNISLVMLYRPSTNKILWYKFGPWRHQHDVDIINSNTIAIFNNNTHLELKSVNNNSNIIEYNFEKNETKIIFEELFKKNKIETYYEGLFEIINENEIFVEEQENGRLLKGNKLGNIIWEYIWDARFKWSRLYNSNNFLRFGNLKETINKIINKQC